MQRSKSHPSIRFIRKFSHVACSNCSNDHTHDYHALVRFCKTIIQWEGTFFKKQPTTDYIWVGPKSEFCILSLINPHPAYHHSKIPENKMLFSISPFYILILATENLLFIVNTNFASKISEIIKRTDRRKHRQIQRDVGNL